MQHDPIHLGIDIGASNTKIVALDDQKQVLHRLLLPHAKDATPIAERILTCMPLGKHTVCSIALTGVGAYQMPQILFGIPLIRVHEFQATGLGGTTLSGLSDALVVSMGTGTSFVHAKGGNYRHIIGSGVGGGTLLGLCAELSATQDMATLEALAKGGILSHIDLTIGEIAPDGHLGLAPDLTASNFGSVKPNATPADLTLGAYNLVFQAIGTMSVLAAQVADTQDIVVVGTLSESSFAQEIFARFAKAYGLRYTIPAYAAFATAYGAVLSIDV